MKYINDMLNEGYEFKEVSIGGKKYSKKIVKHLNVFPTHISLELNIGNIICAPLNQLDYIELEEESEGI